MASAVKAVIRVCNQVSTTVTRSQFTSCSFAKAYSSSSKDSEVYPANLREFRTPSPYKPNDTPTRYGFEQKFFDGGPLPRLDEEIKSLPKYKPKDSWSQSRALFGQNDYIDILSDGNIQPHESIKGPSWLVGFSGNEFARTLRRLKFTGRKLAALHPKLHNDLNKRLRYLYRYHNMGRRSHGAKPKEI